MRQPMPDLRLLPPDIYAAFRWRRLSEALCENAPDILLFKNALQNLDRALKRAFRSGEDISRLIHGRATVMDYLLKQAWRSCGLHDATHVALMAVGGYGRGELHPCSDVDLLLLTEEALTEEYTARLAQFVTFLWDIGLKVGHSVRTVDQCIEMAQDDITVATTLMESRLLAGPSRIYCGLSERLNRENLWPVYEFFPAKVHEQQERHNRFGQSAYRLEPNVKEGPGGLRDIQMVGWVAKRHLGAMRLCELVDFGFLTPEEYRELIDGQDFLWRVRFALHMISGRDEDRLLFDFQMAVAELFGYRDNDHNLAVEQFMQRYYRTVMGLERLNEMLLQLYEESILHGDDDPEPVPINRRFQARRGFLEVTRASIFRRYPSALLEVYLLLQQHAELKGIRASTIRMIREHRHLIDDEYREDIRNRTLFMEILRQPRGVTHELKRMNRHGVLAAYWPSFAEIAGRMQYDLFHIYTVDEHTLIVLSNLRRMLSDENWRKFPLCNKLIREVAKLEVLYLAALFHDIAKGRGGDHSHLGADEAKEFCLAHDLSEYDAELVSWLVRNHLVMSMTAQRQDISDPDVINSFARKIGNIQRLNHLYVLTIADIRGTNPSLWNSWRHTLLLELYHATHRALRRGLENPLQQREIVHQIRRAAVELLYQTGIQRDRYNSLWDTYPSDYFLRHTAEEVAWHTQCVLNMQESDDHLVAIRPISARGSTEIFVFATARKYLFGQTASALASLGLNIVSARIMSTSEGRTLDTFFVLDHRSKPVEDPGQLDEIRTLLCKAVAETEFPIIETGRRVSRQVKHFPVPTRVEFAAEPRQTATFMELITNDHPGLLAQVGKALREQRVQVCNARIATIGERAEDIFYIVDEFGSRIDDSDRRNRIRSALLEHLETLAS